MKNHLFTLSITCCEILGMFLIAVAIYRGYRREKINQQLAIFRQKTCYKAAGDYRGYFIFSFTDSGYTPAAIQKLTAAFDSSMLRNYVEMDWNALAANLPLRYKSAPLATNKTDIRWCKNAMALGSALIILSTILQQAV